MWLLWFRGGIRPSAERKEGVEATIAFPSQICTRYNKSAHPSIRFQFSLVVVNMQWIIPTKPENMRSHPTPAPPASAPALHLIIIIIIIIYLLLLPPLPLYPTLLPPIILRLPLARSTNLFRVLSHHHQQLGTSKKNQHSKNIPPPSAAATNPLSPS